MPISRVLLTLVVVATAAAALPASASAATWRISVKNLTPKSTQPFSPPLVATHSRRTDLWEPQAAASPELAALAEDGQRSPFAQLLEPRKDVDIAEAFDAPIEPGERARATIEVERGARRLSLLAMLVNTNDGFVGVDSLRLGGKKETKRLRLPAWDAGSERNNERREFIPGPCCGNPFVRAPESRLVRRHPGIRGRADLARSKYGWKGAAVKIVARRVSP